MKVLILAAMTMLAAATGRADSLTLVYNGASNACAANITSRQCVTVSNADIARLVAAVRTRYNLDPAMTGSQVLAYVSNAFFGELKALVHAVEQAGAAQTASDAVQPITVTPQ